MSQKNVSKEHLFSEYNQTTRNTLRQQLAQVFDGSDWLVQWIQLAILWSMSPCLLVVTQHSCWESERKEKGGRAQLCHGASNRILAER